MFIHLDLDCFFVSAHRSIDESLNNIPAAVGGRSNLNIFDRKKAVRHISNNSGAFVSSIVTANDDKTPKIKTIFVGQKMFKIYIYIRTRCLENL